MSNESKEKLWKEMLKDPEFEEYIKDIVLNQHLVFRLKERSNNELKIADTAVVNNALFNLSCGRITVKDYAFFGHNVTVLTGTHNMNVLNQERKDDFPVSGRDVVIEQGAWVASNATIAGPCTIGEHAVVAACSFVNKDVPPYAVVAGIPAKVIRYITPPKTEGSSSDK